MKESERLKAAKEIISTPDKWMQNDYCNNDDIEASYCFCALGAIFKARGEDYYAPALNSTSRYLRKAMGTSSIPAYNDTHTHAEVMQMFDAAIALAEAEGN